MGNIKNLAQVNRSLELWLKRVEDTVVAEYRAVTWDVFTRILRQTPQFSGKAVANWNIGVDVPDLSVYVPVVDDILRIRGDESWVDAHRRGDRKWIEVAEARNHPRVMEIGVRSKVFITNSVTGDTVEGASSVFYLESLQDAKYWADKLRPVNKPYEVALESAIRQVSTPSLWRDNFMPSATT